MLTKKEKEKESRFHEKKTENFNYRCELIVFNLNTEVS